MKTKLNLKEFFEKLKLRMRLRENVGLKIASLFISIGLWLLVVNMTDQVIKQKYVNVPVKVINAQYITADDKTLEVVSGSDVISSITIKAPRSVLRELGSTNDNISAVADMTNILADGVSVPISVTTTKYSDKVVSISPSSEVLKVKIEEKKVLQLPLTATTSGSVESGYIIGDVTLGQNQVRVSGPASVIDTVKSASVDVLVTGFNEDISTQADIVLFDKNGASVSKSNLTLNVASVKVDVQILATKKVPIYYATIGSPMAGYDVTGEISCNPETVVIAGNKSAINKVSMISIPASELNLTGQTGNLMSIINLADYLPEGIRFADSSFSGKAVITVYIEKFAVESFGVYLKNVAIDNVPDGFDASWAEAEESFSFKVTGLMQNIEKLQLTNLDMRVDFSDYSIGSGVNEFSEGDYLCSLLMDLPGGVELVTPVKLNVHLSPSVVTEEN